MSNFLRDTAATAAVFGFFASSWFGWAQEKPPVTWKKVLVLGSVLSVLIAVAGAVLTWQHWSDGTVIDADAGRMFGVIVGIEVLSAGLGSLVLALRRKKEWIAPWIAFVVGVHFFPLAWLLQIPHLYVVAALVTAVALFAIPVAKARSLALSAVTGLGTGTVLLSAALLSMGAAVFWR